MQGQWRLGDRYGYAFSLESEPLAWEFLRRNSGYRAAYRSISSNDDAESVARRWGCSADPTLRADNAQITWLPAATNALVKN